jgi:hypothetical protein
METRFDGTCGPSMTEEGDRLIRVIARDVGSVRDRRTRRTLPSRLVAIEILRGFEVFSIPALDPHVT